MTRILANRPNRPDPQVIEIAAVQCFDDPQEWTAGSPESALELNAIQNVTIIESEWPSCRRTQIHKEHEMTKESAWDYPRPPRVEATFRRIRMHFAGELIADSTRAIRVLETSHPPVYYIPWDDIHSEFLMPSTRRTFCEFKGVASYWTLKVGERSAPDAAWSYEQPSHGYEAIRGHLAFYASKVDGCFVDEECVKPQSGAFYAGWITSEVIGPFKGGPGSERW